MNFIKIAAVSSLLLFTSCSGQGYRSPASTEPDSQSVELATKLNGGSVKFRAYRDGDQVSVLGFLDLKFKNCVAKVNIEHSTANADGDFQGSYVDCDVDLTSDPVRAGIKARVQGDKRKFRAHVIVERPNQYNLDVTVDVVWQNKRWTGIGSVTGWLNQRIGNDSVITATVKETLSF